MFRLILVWYVRLWQTCVLERSKSEICDKFSSRWKLADWAWALFSWPPPHRLWSNSSQWPAGSLSPTGRRSTRRPNWLACGMWPWHAQFPAATPEQALSQFYRLTKNKLWIWIPELSREILNGSHSMPATPSTIKSSLVNVPVLSKQQMSILPANGMRNGSVQ